jgi:hypothetical protein
MMLAGLYETFRRSIVVYMAIPQLHVGAKDKRFVRIEVGCAEYIS